MWPDDLDDDERYVRAYLWPPRPGLVNPAMANLDDAHMMWWALSDSRSTRRQLLAELIGRCPVDEVADLAWAGYNADDQETRTAAIRQILDIIDPAVDSSRTTAVQCPPMTAV